jgi:formate hydrogenlyase transcriptional activator
LDVNNNVVSNLNLRDLLRSISATVRQVMLSDAAGVDLPDPDGKHLRIYALDFPESKGFLQEENLIEIEGTGPGQVFRTGEALVGEPALKSNGEPCYQVIGEGNG